MGENSIFKLAKRQEADEIFNNALNVHDQTPLYQKANVRDMKLGDLVMKEYLPTSDNLLKVAHEGISRLLPSDDMESLAAAKFAIAYGKYWTPDVVRVIITESHKRTPENDILNGPQLRPDLLRDFY